MRFVHDPEPHPQPGGCRVEFGGPAPDPERHHNAVPIALPPSPARCSTLAEWRRLAGPRVHPPRSTP
jgi:hypothetical protein